MDSKLIVRAQIRAGAKAHDVNGLMNAYGMWSGLAGRGDATAIHVVERIEQSLRKFVATGRIDPIHLCIAVPARARVGAMSANRERR